MQVIITIAMTWIVSFGLASIVTDISTALTVVASIFALQYLAFIPSYGLKTEKFYDLVGALSHIMVIGVVLYSSVNQLTLLVAACYGAWATRLGLHLTLRAFLLGDRRFNEIKHSPLRFITAWSLQGMWVSICSLPVLSAHHFAGDINILTYGFVGLFALGLILESVADVQKLKFSLDKSNRGKFISSGLWSWVQHPNYLGEIIVWWALALLVIVYLPINGLILLLTPVMVMMLLLKVSGVPLLRARADSKWGDDMNYQLYVKNTPSVFPIKRTPGEPH